MHLKNNITLIQFYLLINGIRLFKLANTWRVSIFGLTEQEYNRIVPVPKVEKITIKPKSTYLSKKGRENAEDYIVKRLKKGQRPAHITRKLIQSGLATNEKGMTLKAGSIRSWSTALIKKHKIEKDTKTKLVLKLWEEGNTINEIIKMANYETATHARAVLRTNGLIKSRAPGSTKKEI